jgi:hypothetical protein
MYASIAIPTFTSLQLPFRSWWAADELHYDEEKIFPGCQRDHKKAY